MLSNAYFLAKIHFDTAENEPAENFQNFAKSKSAKFANFARSPIFQPAAARRAPRRWQVFDTFEATEMDAALVSAQVAEEVATRQPERERREQAVRRRG